MCLNSMIVTVISLLVLLFTGVVLLFFGIRIGGELRMIDLRFGGIMMIFSSVLALFLVFLIF